MFYLLTKEQTNTSRLGCSCGHTALAVPHFRSITLLSSLKPSATSTQEHGSSWTLRMPSTVCRVCNSLCSAVLLTEKEEAGSSQALCEGGGRKGRRSRFPYSSPSHGRWAEEAKFGEMCEQETMAGLSEPQHQPLMLTSHVWESGQDGGTRTRLHSDAASSLPGAQWLGQPKKHTQDSGAVKTSLPFSSKCFLLLTLLAYQWLPGEKRKRKNNKGQIWLAISWYDTAVLQLSASFMLGHASLQEDTQRNHKSWEWKDFHMTRPSWLSTWHVHPTWAPPPHAAWALGLRDPWVAGGWWREWTPHISIIQRQVINCLRTCPGQVRFYLQSCIMTVDDICPQLAASIDEYCKQPVSKCTATCLLSASGGW